MFTDDNGDQMTFFEWGASRAFATADAPGLPFVHMATADPVFNCKVAERSEFVSFDPGQDVFWYNKEQLGSIIDNANILFANQHEVRQMCETLGHHPGNAHRKSGYRDIHDERGWQYALHGRE